MGQYSAFFTLNSKNLAEPIQDFSRTNLEKLQSEGKRFLSISPNGRYVEVGIDDIKPLVDEDYMSMSKTLWNGLQDQFQNYMDLIEAIITAIMPSLSDEAKQKLNMTANIRSDMRRKIEAAKK